MNHAYREEGKKPRKKKKKHHLYAAIVLTLGVVIICLAILILFYVQRIEIKGNVYCTDKMIAEAVQNDRFSINTLYVTAKYAMGKGEIPEVLEDMEVRLKNPWTLRVTVQEKQSIGYIEYKNQRVYFDKEGFEEICLQYVYPTAFHPILLRLQILQFHKHLQLKPLYLEA